MDASYLLVANLKSNKSISEARSWAQEFLQSFKEQAGKHIVVCPSFVHLPLFKEIFSNSSIKIGAQDMSPFDEGPYTGEVSGKQIKELADYVLVGHSERRENFNEDDTMLGKKVSQAVKEGLKVIFFVQNASQLIPDQIETVVYEPTFAIGSGNAETPENARDVSEKIKNKNPNIKVLYGGSVTSENVKNFTQNGMDGVVVGGASLDVNEFVRIIEAA